MKKKYCGWGRNKYKEGKLAKFTTFSGFLTLHHLNEGILSSMSLYKR